MMFFDSSYWLEVKKKYGKREKKREREGTLGFGVWGRSSEKQKECSFFDSLYTIEELNWRGNRCGALLFNEDINV